MNFLNVRGAMRSLSIKRNSNFTLLLRELSSLLLGCVEFWDWDWDWDIESKKKEN